MEWLQSSPLVILLAVALVAFLESFALLGVLVPGVVLLFSLAALANTMNIPIALLLLMGAIGGCTGDISSYAIGCRLNQRIDTYPWFRRHRTWLEQGHWFVQKWGWLSVIIGRFLGPLRPVVPLAAGTLGMSPRLFVPINILTVLVWSPAYLLPGYYTGELADLWRIQPLSTRSLIIYLLSAISISAGLLAIYHHTHPHRWHLRGWITQRQADRWPVGPAALLIIATIWGATLLFWPPTEQDIQLLQWAAQWQTTTLATLGHIGVLLSDSTLILLLFFSLGLWLIVVKRTALLLLLFGTLMGTSLGVTFGLGHLTAIDAGPPLLGLTLFTVFCGFFANVLSSQLDSLRRWPIYAVTSLFLIYALFSHLLTGELKLSETLIAMLTGLIANALLRSAWQMRHLPLFVPLPIPLAGLLILTASAWLSVQL
ncbi:DedA family protein [Reinekea blandensis]|uniref:DedA:Phosphoesterase, PA-phosphatase related protein n=1 Tax=Reinekea blandensis MED297 TaxID=314283 RepID=A4BKT3_9GAMM|nr:DedA family protein [Reinekea blandensis]EAR07271.1 DedA:Phosphoesterase, PA-phosphatase related protein [Reinekea sp. MED297] [Reinekea blandensis MED297]